MFDSREMAHTNHFILLTEICYCDMVRSFHIQEEMHFCIQGMRLSVLSVGQGLVPRSQQVSPILTVHWSPSLLLFGLSIRVWVY